MQLGSGAILCHIAMNLLNVVHKLLLLSSKTLSIFLNSNVIGLSSSPFAPFVLLFSSTWHLPMQLLSETL
ncbi:hypothetical protein BDR04DRAFT_330515 [Suillus decipiens]|nr:hypothetical protein BDR04DRAFT_330515 [Suillus decipiens]